MNNTKENNSEYIQMTQYQEYVRKKDNNNNLNILQYMDNGFYNNIHQPIENLEYLDTSKIFDLSKLNTEDGERYYDYINKK